MIITKPANIRALGRLLAAAALVAAGSGASSAQGIVPAQALRIKQVYKPAATDNGLWTVEVENTSQNVITAYGVSIVCHYPDGVTNNIGVRTFDLGPLLAGRSGIMAQIEYLRSVRPEAVSAVNPGEDPTFGPGASRRDTFSPPAARGGIVPDSVTAAPATVIFDDGRSAGSPDDLATVFAGRRDELNQRMLLIDDLRLIDASTDRAGKLEERLNVLATTRPSSPPAAQSLPGQTHVLLDNPERRRTWQREQLLLLKRLVGSADASGLKPVIAHYEAEAAVYARLSKYGGQ